MQRSGRKIPFARLVLFEVATRHVYLFSGERPRKLWHAKMERHFLEAKYELEQAAIQVKILEEDYSVSGGAVTNIFQNMNLEEFKTHIGNTEVKRSDNDFTSSRLNPYATEFTCLVVKQDRNFLLQIQLTAILPLLTETC